MTTEIQLKDLYKHSYNLEDLVCVKLKIKNLTIEIETKCGKQEILFYSDSKTLETDHCFLDHLISDKKIVKPVHINNKN
jgi:hypothetical protein